MGVLGPEEARTTREEQSWTEKQTDGNSRNGKRKLKPGRLKANQDAAWPSKFPNVLVLSRETVRSGDTSKPMEAARRCWEKQG